MFIWVGLSIQRWNLQNIREEFIQLDCTGIIKDMKGSSVGTWILLENNEELLFKPEKTEGCGFFKNCFKKGDHLTKNKGKNYVIMRRKGSDDTIKVLGSQ